MIKCIRKPLILVAFLVFIVASLFILVPLKNILLPSLRAEAWQSFLQQFFQILLMEKFPML